MREAEPSLFHRLLRRPSKKLISSPWGDIVETTQIASGIVWFRTASRSGYRLGAGRQSALPDYLRTQDGWYEDISEWAGVAVVFDRIFDKIPADPERRHESLYQVGKETLKNWYPEKYEEWFQTTLSVNDIADLAITQFHRLHADRWIAVEVLDEGHADASDGQLLVRAKRGGDPPFSIEMGEGTETRSFLVDGDEFTQRRGKPFLVDPARHCAVDRLVPDPRPAFRDLDANVRGAFETPLPPATESDALKSQRLLERDLREAVGAMAFELRYEPQVDLRTRRVKGFEALLHWPHPIRGSVPCEDFIPVAEETGLIGAIGQWVLEQACRDASGWPEDIHVAVNVSPVQFENGTLSDTVASALRQAGLSPSRLELEITESVPLESDQFTVDVLQSLRTSGVRIVIDDFGFGFSSFSYLLRFAFDKVKIDRSFVTGFGQAEVSNAVVRAIIGLCGSLGITCTAEGVETETQATLLASENCTEAQGHLFSRALSAQEIPSLLEHMNATASAVSGAIRLSPLVGNAFMQIAETANDIIVVTTSDINPPGPTIVYVNPAFTRLTGYTAAEAIGLTPRILHGPGTNRTTLKLISEHLMRGLPVHEKVLNYAKGGAPYWIDLRIVPLRDAKGAITHFAAIERDVTMDKRRLDELEFLADRDTLTGIPNRRAMLRALEAEIACLKAHEGVVARGGGLCVALIDVDRFKQVNDEKGHAVGDAVLCGVADRLSEIVRRSDTLGRIGGEEFAVCMPRVTLRDGKAIAEWLRRAVASQPFDTPSGPLVVTISIGVAPFRPGDTLTTLMERADAAMYAAKEAGRDRVKAHNSEAVM